jgi:hypothetical protein
MNEKEKQELSDRFEKELNFYHSKSDYNSTKEDILNFIFAEIEQAEKRASRKTLIKCVELFSGFMKKADVLIGQQFDNVIKSLYEIENDENKKYIRITGE